MIALIGVGGTLLGTILGWLLNSFSGCGKLKIYVTSWKETFEYNHTGRMINSNSKEQTQSYCYELEFDLYNSSSDIKIMREIKIEFLNGKKLSVAQIPYDDAKTVSGQPFYSRSYVEPTNVLPKSVLHYKFCRGFGKEDLDDIWKSDKVVLSFLDEKNRKRTIFIASLEHDKYFTEKINEVELNGD